MKVSAAARDVVALLEKSGVLSTPPRLLSGFCREDDDSLEARKDGDGDVFGGAEWDGESMMVLERQRPMMAAP